MAPPSSTHLAPMASTTGPKIKRPIVTVPPNAMNHSAHHAAALDGPGERLWRTVSIDVVVPK